MNKLVQNIFACQFSAWLLISTITTVVTAQPNNQWIRYYDNPVSHRSDAFYDVFTTTDSGFALFGYSGVAGNQKAFWLLKTDRNGAEQWQETYTNGHEGNVECWGASLIQTDEGGYVAGGRYKYSDVNFRFYFTVLKMDEDGNQLWWRKYPGNNSVGGSCTAVIELKNDDFVAAGIRHDSGRAYAVMIDGEGDALWDNSFDGEEFKAVREVDDGLLFAGVSGGRSWILRTDIDGEVEWSESYEGNRLNGLISCRGGGFAACGSQSNDQRLGWYLLKVDGDGEREWSHRYDLNGIATSAAALTQLSDGGFVLVGRNSAGNRSAILRTDNSGNEIWNRTDQNRQFGNVEEYLSVIVSPEDRIIVAGRATFSRERSNDGVLLEVVPDVLKPQIVNHLPESLDIDALSEDTIHFNVTIFDAQDDSLSYLWTHNNEEVEPDTVANDTSATTIVFNELGIDTVKCVVSDGALADSIRWIVHVKELYIDTHTPDSLEIAIRRNTTVDFSVTTRAIDGDPVQYEWVHDGEVLDEFDDSLSILFEHGRDHEVEVVAYRGDQNDNVIWQITMLDLIVNYWPREFDLTVNIDTVMEFSIEPFNPDDPSLDILWTVDGDSIDNRSWTFINFDSVGEHQVAVHISDISSADSMSWNVLVSPNDIGQNELDLLPKTPTLYPPSPNPFNSQTSVRYALPVAGEVRLELFDVSGRLVSELVDQRQAAGWYDVVVDGSGLVSGVYFVRMVVEKEFYTQKLLLLK